jgi:hypothetical protein
VDPGVLARGDRRELVGEGGQVVDLLEHVEQVDRAPAADDLALWSAASRSLRSSSMNAVGSSGFESAA